jgi:threonine synthase
VSDADVVDACALLATTEGVLAEPAGGVVVATAKALAARGAFADDETVVLYITGNAYKGTIARPALGPIVAADADAFRAAYAEALA